MVNDDVLIKVERARGHRTDWPEVVIGMKERLREMKLGFPGIGNNHISLIRVSDLKVSDIFIYDSCIEDWQGRHNDEAPIMMRILNESTVKIEGIGCGIDSVRDPDRILIRWGDKKPIPPMNPNSLVWRVDVRPTLGCGPSYYYFFKSYRDFRK